MGIESHRSDFIKRLFSVAVSVGFASQLSKQTWLLSGDWPDIKAVKEFVLLSTSIIAVVVSWDGYFVAITQRPLSDKGRYYVDILIVLLYIFLIIASGMQSIWHMTLCAIFLLYVIWDVLRAVSPPSSDAVPTSSYDPRQNWFGPWTPRSLPFLCYFGGLAWLASSEPSHPFRFTVMAASGVVLFRYKGLVKYRDYAYPTALFILVIAYLFQDKFIWQP